MTYTKKCQFCNITFKTQDQRQRYCSDKCRHEATRQRQRAWRDAHEDYFRDKMRERRAAAKRTADTLDE